MLLIESAMKLRVVLGFAILFSNCCFAGIVYPKEPDGGRQMAMQFASEFVGKNLPPFKGIETTNDLTFGHALPCYGAGDLANGQLLIGAKLGWNGQQPWKYVFLHGSNVIGNAFVQADEKTGKALKCNSVGSDSFSEETLQALQTAEQWPQVQAQDYEVRLLDDMLVSFEAVWLHGKANDIIIPLPDATYDRMNAYQPYSESQIIKILEPEAKRDKIMWANLEKQRKHDNDAYIKAMTDYENAHGGKCGTISLYGMSSPFENVSPRVQIFILQGISSECGKLNYKVKVTYRGNFDDVKTVEILEKLTNKQP